MLIRQRIIFKENVELSTSGVTTMVSRFEQFSAAVACIYRCVQKIERVEMAKYGLKGPHAQCLLAMLRNPNGVTASQLCTICDKDKAAISRTVAELEQEGMIQREMKDGNRYRARLSLTEQGKSAAGQVEERVKLAVEKAGDGMTDDQRAVLYEVLGMIASHLQTICEEGLENV